jgi:hypothetical protein
MQIHGLREHPKGDHQSQIKLCRWLRQPKTNTDTSKTGIIEYSDHQIVLKMEFDTENISIITSTLNIDSLKSNYLQKFSNN